MSKELLTLGMGEAQPGTGKFNVLVLDLQTNEIKCLDLTKEAIIPSFGNPQWDIGKITYVDGLAECKRDSYGNIKHAAYGSISLSSDTINLAEFKGYLEDIAVPLSEFTSNTTAVTALVKPRKIISIDSKYEIDTHNDKKFKARVEALFTGSAMPKNLLCKDYKWVTYWEHMENNNKNEIEMAKSRYVSIMNKSTTEVFFVLYRRFFSDNSNYWIHGLHVM